jgi:hypothetical protein
MKNEKERRRKKKVDEEKGRRKRKIDSEREKLMVKEKDGEREKWRKGKT